MVKRLCEHLRYTSVFLVILISVAAAAAMAQEYESTTEWYEATGGEGPAPELTPTAVPEVDELAGAPPPFYNNATAFDGAFPGLPVEDFEEYPGNFLSGCLEPVDEFSNDPCFVPGDILSNLALRTFEGRRHTMPMFVLAPGFIGHPSDVVGANFFSDTLFIEAFEDVCAVGMTVHSGLGGSTVDDIIVTTVSGQFQSSSPATLAGNFWGVSTNNDPILSIRLIARNGDSEIVDNIRFGTGTCRELEVRAAFNVFKDFNDNNPTEVIVHIDCDHGLLPDQDQNVSEDNPITFVVTEFDHGDMDCEITETVPTGYSASYFDGSTTSSVSCDFDNVAFESENNCWITDDVVPIPFDVRKVWFDEHPEFNNSTFARARHRCENQAPVNGSAGGILWFDGLDSFDTFDVYPHYDGTTVCWVTEKVHDSSVESDDSDCQAVKVLLGQDKNPANGEYECTITNTRFYEGIPTLSQYGLAILALLMLGVGLTGFRRFV